jgi:ADP-ribosylglycohydrolase
MHFNEQELFDRIYACWIGKSIGGTLGTPFEGRRELLDVTGFNSPPGKPLPNDDLDLQLVWLRALENYGPLGVNERVLGEYWINYIPPNWNEYGIGKSNMKAGLPPPLSGDYNNAWKHSNGAWIRSEIWACCTPGRPDLATRYAYYDACVDHGTGEGTYAEIFTATVESAAFVEKDREKLIAIGLSYLPEDCRVARSVRIVVDGYRKKLGWKTVREQVLKDSEDLGWFQAPANVAYVVIGWLYGEGDFKRSLLTAVSCGDDTDCTGATLGSILGITGGYQGIPQDWIAYVGDDIISIAIDRGSIWNLPPTCTELAKRTLNVTRQMLLAHNTGISIGEGPSELGGLNAESFFAGDAYKKWFAGIDGSVDYDFIHARALVKFPEGIEIGEGKELAVRIKIVNKMPSQQHYDIRYILPDGIYLVRGPRHIAVMTSSGCTVNEESFDFALAAEGDTEPVNRIIVEIAPVGRPTVMLVPLLLYGSGGRS